MSLKAAVSANRKVYLFVNIGLKLSESDTICPILVVGLLKLKEICPDVQMHCSYRLPHGRGCGARMLDGSPGIYERLASKTTEWKR